MRTDDLTQMAQLGLFREPSFSGVCFGVVFHWSCDANGYFAQK